MSQQHQAMREAALHSVEEEGAQVDIKDNSGDTPLIRAIYRGNLEMVKYLISVGAEVTIKDNHGDTILEVTQVQEIKDYLRR